LIDGDSSAEEEDEADTDVEGFLFSKLR